MNAGKGKHILPPHGLKHPHSTPGKHGGHPVKKPPKMTSLLPQMMAALCPPKATSILPSMMPAPIATSILPQMQMLAALRPPHKATSLLPQMFAAQGPLKTNALISQMMATMLRGPTMKAG